MKNLKDNVSRIESGGVNLKKAPTGRVMSNVERIIYLGDASCLYGRTHKATQHVIFEDKLAMRSGVHSASKEIHN